jgi:hypothetical protein
LKIISLTFAALLAIPGCPTFAEQPETKIPERFKVLIERIVWFAPHPGCLDKISGLGADGKKQRFFPEQPEKFIVKSLALKDYTVTVHIEGESGFIGTANAIDVVSAFESYGSKYASFFFKQCFFDKEPSVIEAAIKESQPIEFDVYSRRHEDGRAQEIKHILDSDKWLAQVRDKDLKEQAARDALAKKPGAQIGMTSKQVLEQSNWGKPESVNRTVTTNGSDEQWVYSGGNYLYFHNGKLRAIQN